jgi:SAM-dependent methyltransferase
VPDSLDDPGMVAREYASEERLVRRRLDVWTDYQAPNPEDVALAALGEAAPRRVLELGPGPGEFAARIRDELCAEVVAVDISPRLVELVCARGIEAHVGDARALPFESGSFDAAAANWVLYHVPELDRALAELARVLRPGGRLVAVTNSNEHMGELWSLVGRNEPLSFGAENGAALLAGHFARVERRDVGGEVVFPTREALLGYLHAFVELAGEDLAARLPRVPIPFRARVSNAVFVAETAY